jgi:gamma-glutamyltranspeptidase / glutathione hydrolase
MLKQENLKLTTKITNKHEDLLKNYFSSYSSWTSWSKQILFCLIAIILILQPITNGASRDSVRAQNSMVATVHELATRSAVETLKRGNAVDAAVTALFTLAVVWPEAGNLGGGTFFLIRMADGRTEFIDAREVAPKAATRDMYLTGKSDASTVGYRAIAVPGAVAGMAMAMERFGSLKWNEVIEPARQLAANGFPVTYRSAIRMENGGDSVKLFPESSRILLRDGKFPKENDVLTQTDLAATLKRLQDSGASEFYEGKTAELIVQEMKTHGGLIAMDDLKNYKPVIRKPINGSYRGYEVITAPPPSSSGISIVQLLQMAEYFDLKNTGFHSTDHIHLLTEMMKRTFADRALYAGDPGFTSIPVQDLLSANHIKEMAQSIKKDRATPSVEVMDPSKISGNTTQVSIVDRFGNMVSVTTTLNTEFGSGVVAAGTGFFLNNEMDDFTSKPGQPNTYKLIQGEGNAIQPGKRPASSMAPTILVKDGHAVMALGSPGGSKIASAIFQVISNVFDFGMDLQEAVDAPRIHHQWMPDEILYERYAIAVDVRKALETRGHHFADGAEDIGDVHTVMVDPSGIKLGAADPRRGGFALGQ